MPSSPTETGAALNSLASGRGEIMLVAGEASGDRYAGALARALRQARPHWQISGMGGPELATSGAEVLVDASRLGVVGLIEVIRHYPALLAALRRMQAEIARRRPRLLVLIDYQEFNQRLAAYARALGIPVLFFVAPQLWAWRPERAARFHGLVDELAVLFEFEVALFRHFDVPTNWVGHPLAARARLAPTQAEARQRLGVEPQAGVLALLPGSRRAEIARMLPPLLAATRVLRQDRPQLRAVVAMAPGADPRWYRAATGAAGVQLSEAGSEVVLRAADAALITSGTATLEAAVLDTPLVAAYRVNPLTFALLRHKVTIPHIALPNILNGAAIVPECIQQGATPQALAAAVAPLLDQESPRAVQRQGFARVRAQLAPDGEADAVIDRLCARALALAGAA